MPDGKDAALKAWDHARTEIIERLKMRETALLAHITAVFTLGGIYFGFTVRNPTADALTYLVPLSLLFPLLSLVFAQIVSQHMAAIDQLAGFLRTRLDQFLRDQAIWAPHWDEHTDSGDAGAQRAKSQKGFWKHLLVLHAPTMALSAAAFMATFVQIPEVRGIFVSAFASGAKDFWSQSTSTPAPLWPLGIAIACALYYAAVRITWDSFAGRRQAGQSKGVPGEPREPSDLDGG